MDLKNSQTETVLRNALHAELRVSFQYKRFAELARQSGLPQIADIFEATAANETEHARHEFGFLYGESDVVTDLQQAIDGEHEQVVTFYPGAADTAAKEGFSEIAEFFRRIVKIEAKHEANFRKLLAGLENGAEFEGRTVGHSALEMAEVMLPAQANPSGFVHGGELMKLMDNAAGVVATRHARTNVVTARVNDIVFIKPVQVGSLVIVHAKVIFTSRSSMTVRVSVEMEKSGERNPALTADFVMVALDAGGKPTAIPQLILLTEEEDTLFQEAQAKYQARNK